MEIRKSPSLSGRTTRISARRKTARINSMRFPGLCRIETFGEPTLPKNLDVEAARVLKGVGELEDARFAKGRTEDLQAYGEFA